MHSLIVRSSDNTPSVYFSMKEERLELRGRCFPENPDRFFDPIVKWFEDTLQQKPVTAQLDVYLEYFNTGTYIKLLTIFNLLSTKNENGHNLKIRWFVEEEDEDSIDNAKSFQDVIDVPFELCIVQNIDFKSDD